MSPTSQQNPDDPIPGPTPKAIPEPIPDSAPGSGGGQPPDGPSGPSGMRPRRRWVTLLLAVSLALNLLVLGMMAGAAVKHLRGTPGPERVAIPAGLRGLGYEPFVAALPEAARRDLLRAAQAQAGALGPDRAALRAEFAALLDLLRSDSFDPGRFDALLATQATRLGERQRLGRDLLRDQLAAMSADERRVVADRLQHSLRAGARLKRGKP